MAPVTLLYFLIALAIIQTSEAAPKQPVRDAHQDQLGNVVVVDIEDAEKTQYYKTNYDTGAYSFGYKSEPNELSFRHENRGPDGVIYGCYGYLDELRRAIYYVADSHGYRLVELHKPVKVYPVEKNAYDKTTGQAVNTEPGKTTPWNNLYFPEGCVSSLGAHTQSHPIHLGKPAGPSGPSYRPPVIPAPLGDILTEGF